MQIDNVDPKGLTVRSIIESAAMLIQKRIHLPRLTPKEDLQMLHYKYVEGEYREAYEVAVRYLGEVAFNLYPLLSYLSLCTSEPAEVSSLSLQKL